MIASQKAALWFKFLKMLAKECDKWLAEFRAYVSRPENDHVLTSINVINRCLQSLDYDLSRFCISFNGGKDCTVLLHLLYLVLLENFSLTDRSHFKLLTLLIVIPDSFPELNQFVKCSEKRYNLDIISVDGPDFKLALKEFKSISKSEKVTHIFMGTRSTDLSVAINYFQPTDKDWPQFTRVSPLLHWSFSQIWDFLLQLKINYCPLYDRG